MRSLRWLALLLALLPGCAFAQAEPSILGKWVEGEKGATKFTYINISEKTISYANGLDSSKTWCTVKYEVVDRSTGDSYPDQLDYSKTLAISLGRRFNTVIVKLQSSRCTGTQFVRFASPSDVPNYLDVVEYQSEKRPVSWSHYQRIK